ncbi:MAG: isochorismate synthase [Candidatus Neptunochlamydia sp.]|nr:isochorismate synthase [Candidatus Neptunochlamydia sp.]
MQNRLITPPNEILTALLKTPFKPKPLIINGQEIPYMRIEIPIEIDDIFAFLKAQTLYPKIYWENPEDGIVAGIGSALLLDSLPLFESQEGPRFFGGSDFMKRSRDNWGNFPETSYFLPLIEIERRESGIFLCINRVQENLDLHLIEENPLKTPATMINRLDFPPFPVWEHEVNEILQGIKREDYLKVVLARLTQFEFEESLSPYALLKNLEGKNRFSFQFSPETAFIGVSPETLYRRKKSCIESAAVAGTCPRGKTETRDEMLMNDLINNPKEQHEFRVVKNRIHEALSPLCESLEVQDQKVLKTPTVQHLYHTFQGTLKEGIRDAALIEALHPTPAVGGSPKKEAFDEIGRREQFDRGWYAAPVGWVSPIEAHHLVGIRSALIEKNYLHLFAGTGIVLGSIPSKEWDELEHKIKQYVRVLRVNSL